MDTFPTADEVAHAIVAACQKLGADPIRVASGEFDEGTNYSTSRARAYAALALDQVFECGAVAISKMVGSQSHGSHLAAIRTGIRKGTLRWFNPDTVDHVVAEIEAHRTTPAAYRPPPGTTAKVIEDDRKEPTHVFAPGKRALYDMLANAVANTAKLPRSESD